MWASVGWTVSKKWKLIGKYTGCQHRITTITGSIQLTNKKLSGGNGKNEEPSRKQAQGANNSH